VSLINNEDNITYNKFGGNVDNDVFKIGEVVHLMSDGTILTLVYSSRNDVDS
jgi:hypothetical protein